MDWAGIGINSFTYIYLKIRSGVNHRVEFGEVYCEWSRGKEVPMSGGMTGNQISAEQVKVIAVVTANPP
jgi:hypothetical protein